MDLAAFRGFEWDLGNIPKIESRLDLATVEFAFQGTPYMAFDEKHSTGEKRWHLANKVGNRFVFVVFTTRGNKVRVLSARYMRKQEVKRYENWFQES